MSDYIHSVRKNAEPGSTEFDINHRIYRAQSRMRKMRSELAEIHGAPKGNFTPPDASRFEG